jgi:hypothetical protein
MFCYRITKYNPDFRDENGAFQHEDWTAISDIGKKFSGRILTFEDYLLIEDKYISSALHFLNEASLAGLCVVGLEQKQDQKRDSKDIRFSKIDYKRKAFREGMQANGSDIPQLCRLILREIIWCRLESNQNFYIHFGWDFYMYIGTSVWPDASVDFARQQGLFVEEMESPYSNLSEE